MKGVEIVSLLILALAASFFVALDAFAQNPKPLKIALVFDIGGRGDGGFDDSACNGLEKAVADLGTQMVTG